MPDTNPKTLLDRLALEKQFSGYTPPSGPSPLPSVSYTGLDTSLPNTITPNVGGSGIGGKERSLSSLENFLLQKEGDGRQMGGSISRSLEEVSSNRYGNFVPGDYNNEDAYGQGQNWGEKMVNGVGKGLLLTGTTFLQSTVGLVNGLYKWGEDGRPSSFYDNEFTRNLDEINKAAEDALPNYYTDAEKNANWYSPTKLISANFLWDGIVKNMGFAAGAALSGGVYASALRAFPLTARLFSVGKAAEALAATEEGLLAAGKIAETYGKVRSLSDKFLKSYNVMNPAGRAVVAGLSTTGEAGFEAYHNLNDFRNEKIEEFKSINGGLEPMGADLERINQMADEVGNSSFLANAALLTATNYIQFPKILGSSYTAEKGVINSLTKGIDDIVEEGGTFVVKKAKGGKFLSTLNKIRPYTFSTSEAFEEGAQFAIGKGVQDYYNKQYQNQDSSFIDSFSTGISETIGSNEGMESILIGGLSGAIMMGKGRFQENTEKSRNTTDAIQSFNKFRLSDFTKATFNSVNRGVVLQEEREALLKQGDINNSKDVEADYVINYLTPRIKYGRYDLVTSEIADYRALASTDVGFSQLKGEGKALETDTKESYLKRLSGFEQTADNVKSMYQSLNLRYGGAIDKDGNRMYTDAVIDKMVYATAKIADYDKRIPELTNKLITAGIDINQVVEDLVNGDVESFNAGIETIQNLPRLTDDQKEDIAIAFEDVSEMSIRRDNFLKEYNEIKGKPQNFKSNEETSTTEVNEKGKALPKETINVKTKSGIRDLEVGTEYFIGKMTERSEKGHKVFRSPIITILGKNEDGTIKIKDSDGLIHDLSESLIEQYRLGRVSSTKANKKAMFYMTNWNKQYRHYGRKNKDGSPVLGRLDYNSKDRILNFTYIQNGKIKTEEVTGDQFVAKKGYVHGMIKETAELTAAEQKIKDEFVEEAKTDPRVDAKRAKRLEILNELFEDLSKRQAIGKELIDKKQKEISIIKAELEKLTQDIQNAESDKRAKSGNFRFKSVARKALQNAMRLSRTVEQLEQDIERLETDREEIEFNLGYIADLAGNIDNTSTNFYDFMADLEEETMNLEILQEETIKQINLLSRLLKETQAALDSAIKFISNIIQKFESKYPDVPTIMGQPWVDYLKSNPMFLFESKAYKEELQGIEDSIALLEDADITPNEVRIEDLQNHLSIMAASLVDVQKQISAREVVLNKFAEIAERHRLQVAEEDKMSKNEALRKAIIGTLMTNTQATFENDSFEAASKKDDLTVVGSTRPVDDGKPHQERANIFGANIDTFENRDEIKGSIVTSKTEGELIPGLTEHLLSNLTEAQKEKYSVDDVIVLVMTTTTEEGLLVPVDQKGQPILDPTKYLTEAIYQVFPAKDLKGNYVNADGKTVSGSMFREDTSKEVVDSLTAQYSAWRDTELAKTTLDNPVDFKASFGIPEYVQKWDDTKQEFVRDYDARVPVQETGLLKKGALKTNQVIEVATNNESVTEGKVTFNTPLGRVFLRIPGKGLVKLLNRKLNKAESENIYNVILQISKNAQNDGELKQDSLVLFEWLKSVVYWGIPKDQDKKRKTPGYNSVWFEEVYEDGVAISRLFISGKTTESTQAFEFTPSALENRKGEITFLLEQLYNNTNATKVNDKSWNTPYVEITGLNEEGKPIVTTWPNYQTYLLSNKSPNEDGDLTEKRNLDIIPLVTQLKPLASEEDTNRKSVYFTLSKTAEDFALPEEKKTTPVGINPTPVVPTVSVAPVITPVTNTPTPTPVVKIPPAPKPKKVYKLDGSEETITMGTLGELTFKLDAQKQNSENPAGALSFPTDSAPIKALMLSAGVDQMTAVQQIYSNIIAHFGPQIASMSIPVQAPIEDKVIEVKPAENVVITPAESTTPSARPRATRPTDDVYRLQLIEEAKQFETENWKKVEEFIKTNFPNVPVYRVKNMIQATNGKQAWGMLHDGAIYIYENAEVGTAYHEIFEAVWKMFEGPKNKQKIIDEFRNREGSYNDRFTGESVQYKDATAEQLKEEIAEEFRDFVLTGKMPTRVSNKSLIARMFTDLVNFIKEFFTGKSAVNNTQKLFDRIGNGYYAQYNPYESKLSYANKGIIDIEDAQGTNASEYRIQTIPALQVHDILQQMTYSTLAKLTKDNKNLFTKTKENKKELYTRLKEEVLNLVGWQLDLMDDAIEKKEVTAEEIAIKYNNTNDLYNNISLEWDSLVKKHQEQLKTFSIEFDENDDIDLESEESSVSGKSDWQDATKIDSFRKANSAIKLLLGTLPIKQLVNNKSVPKRSSIGGFTLMAADAVHIDLTNKLFDSTNIEDMFFKLKELAVDNDSYATLYRRLTNSEPDNKKSRVDFSNLDNDGLVLVSAFWKSIKKQNADVVSVFILSTGEVVISDSTLSSSTKASKKEMLTSMAEAIKANKMPYLSYNAKSGKYSATDTVKKIQLKSNELKQYVDFLKNLGIDFTVRDLETKLNDSQLKLFKTAVDGILTSLKKVGGIVTIDGVNIDTGIDYITTKSLDIDKRLTQLGTVRAIIENPEFESTYFNINGERSQNYIGTNATSELFNTLSKLKNIKDLNDPKKGFTSFKFLLTDKFAKGSVVLKKMFDIGLDGTGNRIENSEGLLKPVFIDGTIDDESGKKTASSKQTIKQRLIQELNLNTSGIYMNLVPGDAAIEHAIKMHEEGDEFVTESLFSTDQYFNIFKDYLISEIELSRDSRVVAGKNKATDLRFFKAILGETLHDKIIKNKTVAPEQIYKDNKEEINKAIKAFIINEAKETEDLLKYYGILENGAEGLVADKLLFAEGVELTDSILKTKLGVLSVNYIIANIEMHKLIYSDPYQYKDELKRIKNFNSPRQLLLHGSVAYNESLDASYNKYYAQGDIGHSDMNREHFRTITLGDVWSVNENLGYDEEYEETDGGGMSTLRGHRILKIRSADWTVDNERQYMYDIAFEKNIKKLPLNEYEKLLLKEGNPGIKSTYTPIKPIVSGSKDNGRDFNDVVMHKYALYPLSFRILYEINPESNAIKLYNKMQNEDIDYAVYSSGSKVGTEKVSPLYNDNGTFNETSFEDEAEKKGNLPAKTLRAVSNIPFSIMGIQAEVPSKETASTTQGSQITKLVTMDFLEGGVPINFEVKDTKGKIITDFGQRFSAWYNLSEEDKLKNSLYKEIKQNQMLLEAKIEDGYKTLLKKLGIKETTTEQVVGNKKVKVKSFTISDVKKLSNTLREEILKREVNDNVTDAFEGFEKGDVVLEATPAYQQIRNILYSIADKNVVRPKISGGMKVQIPSTLLESNRIATKTINGKTAYTSDVLGFYKDEDGKRVCEVMVGRWFKSNKTDAQLLDYFNNTEEGQKELAALSGVGYRIPTQKQNSIDAFKIKQFLPKEFGDSVVVPSALVKKVGSDFDIDKLSIYLKNMFTDSEGKLKVVPFLGIGEEAKNKFFKLFDEGKLLSKSQIKTLNEELSLVTSTVLENDPISKIFEEFGTFTEEDVLEDFIQDLKESGVRETVVDKMYKQSLENAYITSLEKLISNPLNYSNLVKPNDAEPLKSLAKKINAKLGRKEIDYAYAGNMLSRKFMSGLRQAFVTGKYAIGIAAVAQTGHAQRQRTPTYLDFDRLKGDLINDVDKAILGNSSLSTIFATDTNINFQEYNSAVIDGKESPVLAMVKSKSKNPETQYISDVNGMFIDGYVDISKGPWIMELGATPNVASTWLFLVDLGVPIETIAYFMNQPIIKDYLANIENKGYSWLFIDNIIEDSLDRFASKTDIAVTGIPSEAELLDLVGKDPNETNSKSDKFLTDNQKAQQQYMLKEFLKYAKMASHVFEVTQGSNFDTATINDPYLVFKKQMQLKKARTTIISSVDKILENSFVGPLKDIIFNFRDAFATVLISDRSTVRNVMETVLTPYIGMNDRNFVKTSQKAVNDLFDWAVQTDMKINRKVASILLGNTNEASAAEQIIEYRDSIIGNPDKGITPKEDHPLFNNIILNSLKMESGLNRGENKVNNLFIVGRENKVYDQNLIIHAFNEIKKTMSDENKDLYGKMVRLAVLQSGLTNSPIAFTNLLPYEDFKEVYNKTLSNLEKMPNLADFHNLRVFERNNWNNRDIIPFKKAKMEEDMSGRMYNRDLKLDVKLTKAVANKAIPKIVGISKFSSEGRSDFMVYSWEDKISQEVRKIRRRSGDRSHVNKMLMQKVYTTDENGNIIPLVMTTTAKSGRVYQKYIYKAVNAWGDSFRAQEFYAEKRASVLNNDFTKIEYTQDENRQKLSSAEVEDDLIISILNGEKISFAEGMDITQDELLEDYSQTTGQPIGNPIEVGTENTFQKEMEALKEKIEELSYMISLSGEDPEQNATIKALKEQVGKILKKIC
jgi:hypothetical protein